MLCEHSKNCIYYRTYRYKPDSKQYRLLVESYCEGNLQPRCRRLQYEAEYCKEVPEELAPNGYLAGTHKKLKTDNTRKFERHRIKGGACMLQVLDTKKTFTAGVIDISEGGMCLELYADPEELDLCSNESVLKILGHTMEDAPLPLDKEVIKTVWRNNKVVGCAFVDASHF